MTADEDPNRRVVVANGMDLDKRYFFEVTKRMARDGDLRKISLFGPPVWTLLSLIGIALAVSGLFEGVRSFLAFVSPGFADIETAAELAIAILGTVFTGLVLLVLLYVFLGDVVDLESAKRRLRNIRNITRRDVWQNLNYWHPFTSHLAGRDPLVPLSAGGDHAVAGIYADGPHYQNVFLDAVYVRPRGNIPLRQRIAYGLYRWDHGRRHLRRALYGLLVAAAVVTGLVLYGVTDAPALDGPLVVGTSGAVVVVLAVSVVAIDYPYLQAQFYSDSAGLSRYRQLLNDEQTSYLSKNEEVGLANSMCGYGLFYVSRFLATLFGRCQYDVEVNAERLGVEDAFPASATDQYPGAVHAVAAAAELLWSAVPATSVREAGGEADVTLELAGVDYPTVSENPRGDEELSKATVGERTGFRLPVKKFMSVRDGFAVNALRVPERPLETLHDRSWPEDEVDVLFLGGGEHQQAINKLVLALKAEGYDNVDVRENAFSVESTAGLIRRVRAAIGRSEAEPVPEQADRMIHLPTEYFVSLVSGGEEFFRQDPDRHGHGFLLFRHTFEADETPWTANILIGMSAPGTKLGALFWQKLFTSDFTLDGLPNDLEEDVMYFFDAKGPTDHPICRDAAGAYDDIGELYLDTSWLTAGLEFTVAPLDDYQPIAKVVNGQEKQLGIEYYELALERIRE